FRALQDTVLGECQHFNSCDLPQEDKEQEEMQWEALAPPLAKAGADMPTRNKDSLREYLKKKTEGDVMDLTDICWRYRQLCGPVKPGSVRGHFHRIDLDTQKDSKARRYPLRNESQREAARKEIDELLKG